MAKERLKKLLLPTTALSASAAMLTFIQAPFDLGFLGWLCLVPFIITFSTKTKPELLMTAYIISTIYWLANLYWLIPVTIPGWLVLCAYLGLYWPICAKTIQYCCKKNIPIWISVPLIVVGAETFQGIIFNGFDWRLLAHCQYKNSTIIQIADIFGTPGVSFLIAAVNGLIAQLIIEYKNKNILLTRNILAAAAVASMLFATALYGRYRITQTPQHIQPGPTVAVVQSNVPVVAGQETQSPETTFIQMLDQSTEALKAEPDLIVWPETMVETVLDDRFLEMTPQYYRANIFDKALKKLSEKGTYLLIGAFGGKPVDDVNVIRMEKKYNSAFLYRPDGTKAKKYYNKIHLVMFGEYVPFQKTNLLHKILLFFASQGYDYTLDPGSEYTVFQMQKTNKKYNFSVLICYEDTVSKIGRKMTLNKNNKKQIDWLVNISNDGWFTRKTPEKSIPTTELTQHAAISIFRAVENRLSIVRSANTGISCIVNSLGIIQNGFIKGNLPENWKMRGGKKGYFTDQIYLDNRVTFFSKHGPILEIYCGILFTLTAILSIYKKWK